MRPEQPEIARPADRVLRRLRDLVLALAGAVLVAEPGEQPVQLVVVEAGQRRGRSRRPAGRRARARAAPRPTRRSRSPGCPSAGRRWPAPASARGRCAPARSQGRAAGPPRAGCARPGSPSPRRRRSVAASRTPSARPPPSRPRCRSSAGCGHRGSAARAAVRRRPSDGLMMVGGLGASRPCWPGSISHAALRGPTCRAGAGSIVQFDFRLRLAGGMGGRGGVRRGTRWRTVERQLCRRTA